MLETVGRNLLHDPDVRGIVVNRRDVTEQQAAEERLRESQRLETVAQLAGGVAHDFNNLLTVILSCAIGLKHDLQTTGTASVEDADEVRTAAERARDLTRKLLTFARREVVEPAALDLNTIIRENEGILRRVLAEDIAVVVGLQPDLWTIRCDRSQLEQILLNLAVNAGDAMPGGGTVWIETSNVQVGDDYRNVVPHVRPGPYVRFAVRDSGVGMSPDVKARIFEPFFTTKPVGKGTGLGLPTVWGIVKQSDGHIHVDSAPGRGTTVEVLFPRAFEESRRVSPEIAPERGSGTVLVVEDEPSVRRVTARTLRAGGYQAIEAASGAEALEILVRSGSVPDALVTDVVMPGMSGPEVADAVRKMCPCVRVLFVSGHVPDVVAERGGAERGFDLLQKPFAPGALLARVRRALEGRDAGREPA